MKKILLLLALILSSFVCIGQENSTFVKKYISMVSTKNGVLQPWEKTDITVVFNSDNLKDIVFYYPSGNTLTFHQIGGVEEGTTEDGKEYQLIHCIDEDGVKMRMQLFSHDSCLRILIAKGYMVEFYKD